MNADEIIDLINYKLEQDSLNAAPSLTRAELEAIRDYIFLSDGASKHGWNNG